jgi:Uncharacterized conserved protein
MSEEPVAPESRFLADRMLGPLTRYLRFMGYDTISANGWSPGDPREDSKLLDLACRENRILLTRDRELALRGKKQAVLIVAEDITGQIDQLIGGGLISRRLLMCRCSLCNTVLRRAAAEEIASAPYAPQEKTGYTFFWCEPCGKLYWNGSHQQRIRERIVPISLPPD